MFPDTVVALAVFMLAIAPGFLAVRGYSRRRYRTVPDRDLYAVAQAVVVSAMWLALVWLILLKVGDPIRAWGLIPNDTGAIRSHQAAIVGLGFAVVTLPYGLGLTAAYLVDRLEGVRSEGAWRRIRRTGLVRPPTAWDRAWLTFRRRQGAGQVVVRLKNGLVIRGGYGKRSQADLSPSPHQLFLESGFGYAEGEDGDAVEVEAEGSAGIFIEGSEIAAIYFQGRNADEAAAPTPPRRRLRMLIGTRPSGRGSQPGDPGV